MTKTFDIYHLDPEAVRDVRSGRWALIGHVSIASVEAIYEIDETDVEWAIEEHGVCETEDNVGRTIRIVEHGQPVE